MGARLSWPSPKLCAGPLLYIIYSSELSPLLTVRGLLYADDVQAYLHCLASNAMASGGDQAPSLGGTKNFFTAQDFRITFFRKRFPFSRPKFLMTFFLVIDQVFRIFPFFSQIFRLLYYVKCRI